MTTAVELASEAAFLTMLTLAKPFVRTAAVALLVCGVAAAAAATAFLSRSARAATVGGLQRQIAAGQGRASALAGTVQADDSRLGQMNVSVAALERDISRIQTDLATKQARLSELRTHIGAVRRKLSIVEAADAHAEGVLAQLLVSAYESGRPNLVNVVLDATGFQDLLERVSFEQRIRDEDIAVIRQVRAARRAVAAQATRLGALEVRQQALIAAVQHRHDQLAAARIALVREELALAQSRRSAAGRLGEVRRQVTGLQRALARLQAVQAAAAGAARSTGAIEGANARAGGFAFPLPTGAVVGPSAWTPDDGVDMAAPGDIPEFAVCSGTIVLHGIGGFGPWAPVLHCDYGLGGYSYVYYGHAGPLNQLPVGTHVTEGQTISSVGPGIVGFSTGPHIEIGFADASGDPIGPSSAGTMLALLHASY